MPKESRDIISKALGVEPILINSALVSAQQRRRLYWTNIPDITQPQDKGLLLKDILDDGMPYEEKACALTASYDGAVIWNSLAKKQRTMIAKPVCLGNLYGQNTRWGIFDKDGKAPTLTASMGLGGGHTPMVADAPQSQVKLGEFGGGGQGYRVYSVVGKSVALKKEASNGSISEFYKIDLPNGDYIFRKLSPIECERLQTLPDNYTEGVSNTQRYKMIGNGWTVDVIAHIFSFIKE